jgi:hypothetical protein
MGNRGKFIFDTFAFFLNKQTFDFWMFLFEGSTEQKQRRAIRKQFALYL